MPNSVLPKENNSQTTTERTVYQVVRFMLSILIVGLVLFSIVIMVAFQPASDDPFALDEIVTIAPGTSGNRIAQQLADKGVVRNPTLFRLVLRLTKMGDNLQAGYYRLNPTMTTTEIIEQLRIGRGVSEQVIIPEGYDLKQIASALAQRELIDMERFLFLAEDVTRVFGSNIPLEIPIASVEGYLFPDTYRFVRGQTEEDIIRQMVNRFLQVVLPAVEEYIDEMDMTLHEIVTLASIVEKEVMTNRERPIVAAVYLNRLAIDMPLQADPTVRYVMEEQRSRVLYRDLEIDSPYNTYQNRGLPPGPIASPGLASILAVLEPADVDYFFFVSRGDGTHQFTRTFNEHVRARRELGY